MKTCIIPDILLSVLAVILAACTSQLSASATPGVELTATQMKGGTATQSPSLTALSNPTKTSTPSPTSSPASRVLLDAPPLNRIKPPNFTMDMVLVELQAGEYLLYIQSGLKAVSMPGQKKYTVKQGYADLYEPSRFNQGILYFVDRSKLHLVDLTHPEKNSSFSWGLEGTKYSMHGLSPSGRWFITRIKLSEGNYVTYLASMTENMAFTVNPITDKKSQISWFDLPDFMGDYLALDEFDGYNEVSKRYLIGLDDPERILDCGKYCGESVSPDSRWLAWKESEGGAKDIGFDSEKIFIAPADCLLKDPFDCQDRLEYLVTLPYSVGTELLWMPDSQGLVWSLHGPGDKPSMIGEVNLDGSSRVWGSYYNIYPSSWSPDGEWLFAHAMLFTRDGRGVQLPEDIYSNVLGWFSVP